MTTSPLTPRKTNAPMPAKIQPKRHFANFGDEQLPVIIFSQDTLKGDRLILAFHSNSDRLWRWKGESNSWQPIRPDAISPDRKKNLLLMAR